MGAKRVDSQVLEQRAAFVEAKVEGLSTRAAAAQSGTTGQNLMQLASIKEQIESARRWLTDTTQIKRLDVIEGVIDGIELARMQGDAGNVIRGWTEVAKILGHYAPEVKRIELSIGQARMRSKFESLSDEELLAIASGNVVEGELVDATH